MLRNHLYRTLLKLGRKFDHNPRHKAFIFASEARFPAALSHDDDSEDEDFEIVMHSNAEKVMKHYVDSVCAPGIFYKPQVSLEQVVRNGFRQPTPLPLTTVEQHQVGFMAVRLLFNCERLGNEASSTVINAPELTVPAGSNLFDANQIISIEPALSVEKPSTAPFGANNSQLLELTDKLEPGVLLVSHPLNVVRPLGNAVVLVTQVSEDHCSGMIINKEFRESFKTLLDKRERIRYGYYLKEFYDCACFNGGDGEYLSLLNYCILHQVDGLAAHSRRIDLSDPTSLQELFREEDSDSDEEENEETGKENGETGKESDREVLTADRDSAVLAGSSSSDSSQSQSADRKAYVYFSHDFQGIAKELAKGTVSKKDIKIIRGIMDWTDGELQESIAQQKLWMVRPNISTSANFVTSSSSPSSSRDAAASSPGSVVSDIVMARPVPHDYTTVNLSDCGGWEDPALWVSGNYAWCNALYSLGGEYRDIARLHNINSSDKADAFLGILNNLTEYGKREFPASTHDDEDDDGSDFDDADFAHALELLDEDGNPSGELIIAAAAQYLEEEDDGEDFSDDDDDE